jgi:DNA (cytosine-5)-methyltransferase 1
VIHYPFLNLTEYRRFSVKFLSICSGIEAASVAWGPLGWEAVAFSEIEPFPCAVLAHHYPHVPNLGDMTKFDTWPEEIFLEADLIVGGPPCQAFSVAGNREGLADDRGNLTLVYVQLINHADLIRKKHGKEPVIAFYENVPGLFSDKTNAYGCLLGALAGEDGALLAPGGKWTDAGCVSGPQRTMAWRLLDAQYFGLAQRRRRVFLVASARDGLNPAEILFECEGVRRDSAPSRETGQEVAGTIAARAGDGGQPAGGGGVAPTVIGNVEGGAATTLSSREYKGLSCGRDGMTSAAVVYEPAAYSIREDATANNFSATPLSVSNALQAHQPSVQSHHAQVFIAQAIPIHDQATRFAGKRGDKQDGKGNGLGIGEPGAPMNTLTKGDRHAVAHPTVLMDQGGSVMSVMEDGTVGTLRRETHGHEPSVLTNMAVRRLTPVECERLQGFPDDYTNIPWRGKPEAPDGPRYKALGNSWAVPNVRWIGARIDNYLKTTNGEVK